MRRHIICKQAMHYRTKQRQYLQWKTSQEEQQEELCYFPPHLRELRNEWFAQRYEKYRKQVLNKTIEATTSSDTGSRFKTLRSSEVKEESDESDAVRQRIWWWLSLDDNDEDRGRPLQKDGK
jgi:hypothetical protein